MTSFAPEPLDNVDEQSGREGMLPIREILLALRRRWWVVVGIFIVVVAVGMWRTLRQPRLYRASVTVRVQEQQAPIRGLQEGGGRYDYRVDPLKSEQMLIRSQVVAERVAEALGLRLRIVQPASLRRSALLADARAHVDSAARNGEYRLLLGDQSYSLRSGGTELGSARYGDTLRAAGLRMVVSSRPPAELESIVLEVVPLESAAGTVRSGISTQVLEATDIVQISYIGTDPRTVQAIVDEVALNYQRYSAEGQRASARGKTAFIEQSLRDQRQIVLAAQEELQRFKEANRSVNLSADLAALLETIHAVERDRHDALVQQEVYREILGKLAAADTVDEELRRLSGTQAVTSNEYMATLYDRWFELLRDRERLLTGSQEGVPRTVTNPDVVATERMISATKEELRTASELYLKGLRSKMDSYSRRLAELRQQAERFPPLLGTQAQLESNVRTAQATYDELMSQYQMARIAESVDEGKVRIIDQAGVPRSPVSPNRRRALVLLSVLGLLLGAGVALLLERLDTSVKSPDELPNRFGIPVLGLIPTIKLDGFPHGSRDAGLSRLASHADPRSSVAEAYRSLRTNIAFARAQGELRTIVLTSPGPADGKSTSVANLAITFAQQGQRVLLIDADLRRAVLDRAFGVPRTPGLTDVLVGRAVLADALSTTEIEGLSVLGSGQFPPNPSELLGSTAMRRVLDEAKANFDIVLLDSPPLLAVTDAAVIATMVDGAILVVRMDETAREAVRRGLMQLRAVQSRVLGALLNDVDLSKSSYYGGYGYYYYAYYGEPNGNGRKSGALARLQRLMGRSTHERITG